MRPTAIVLLLAVLLSGCETPIVAPHYPQSTETAGNLRAARPIKIGLSTFVGPARLENCRGLKPLNLPAEVSPSLYIQQAFEAEFRAADILAPSGADITLSGRIDTATFSSTKLITMGQWTIGLSLRSSNGKTLRVVESHEFDSAFEAREACRYTADAFAQAVQKLVAKTVSDPGFPGLLNQR